MSKHDKVSYSKNQKKRFQRMQDGAMGKIKQKSAMENLSDFGSKLFGDSDEDEEKSKKKERFQKLRSKLK